MQLYKVTLSYSYNYERKFNFLVASEGIKRAKNLAMKRFNEYGYGDCQLHSIELLASEGQYSKPEILIVDIESLS